MRTVLLSKHDELYLEKCAQENQFSYGIIVGHQADLTKSVVVHLARNNEEDADLEDLADVRLTISDINSQALASQWLSASKMCPGSFDVIGIFVSSVRSEVVNEQSPEFKNAKKLFSDIYDLLLKSNSSFGVYTTDIAQTDFVFLSYSLADKKVLCKNYSYGNGGTFSNMEYRFVDKPFEWIQLECSYDLDDVLPILDSTRRVNIEDQFQHIIVSVRKNLLASEVFLQNEVVEDTIDLQAYIKKKKAKVDKLKPTSASGGTATAASNTTDSLPQLAAEGIIGSGDPIRASIVLPVKCQLSKPTDIKVREFNGTLHMSGIIATKVFCSPRNSIADVKRFLRDDVLRSLITRIQVYCDGLTDPYVTNEALYISEPPRRVFFSLPSEGPSTSIGAVVQFSEYLFRGEAPTVVVAQAKQILDVELDPETISVEAEGLPDDANFTNANAGADRTDDSRILSSSMPKPELSRSLYMVGIAVALLVLLASVALHYVLADR
ncbi:protein odr-4 homolog isoform X2 [Drosophila subpulchrella]|uniref:protein odr-4 homolog isoform X2 n=1 Tax=Drosophila subpulchrella TaxID=1486046 RepID=UPI0018A19E2E|nr:protein odr-4 homolog isoform X2 [Drosophila subpulchrella]